MIRDHLDLEQAIMACWNTADDIDLIADDLVENAIELDADALANALIGLSRLCSLRASKAFDIYSELVGRGLFRPPAPECEYDD